ncbi:EAL domain protein [Alkalibacterium sp. AK22]|uniref:EAL domain-containing protein n=1 Tax=Alkalibacterium sp. AK22 TaxID=1229520 RepID=UPI0004499EAE|nr:EAL domain-containing protein [Alkalibacterium sp. AK22]EXJ22949.1 EAL domain protein [Alkalibacterium sp. AK22]
MTCPNCTVSKQRITLKLPEEVVPPILIHFAQKDYPHRHHNKTLATTEEAAADVADFLTATSQTAGAYFKIHEHGWQPIEELANYIESSWVDHILQEKYIRMHFQPIIMPDGTLYGYEMLARFQDQDGSMIYPDRLFPAAKARGRLFALDRLCRMNAVRQITRLPEQLKAFINFVPTAIYNPEYCLKTTSDIANQLSIDSSRFVFEVVETEKIADLDHLKSILEYYRSHGFHYALDDVGAGSNTLSIVEDLEPPYMKLDMQYVQGVSSCLDKQEVALKFLEIADTYGAVTLAEGVECFDDFEWLKSKGYQLFQGYFIGRPLPEPLDTCKIELANLMI